MQNEIKIPYYNRELSWLDFNERVLEEAVKRETPLMERLKFLAITSSNLDEFFMVRIAGVKAQVSSGIRTKDPSGLTPNQLVVKLEEKTHSFMDKQYSCFTRALLPALKKNDIHFIRAQDASALQNEYLDAYFEKVLYPVLTPLAIDNSRPFPLLSNKSLNIAVRLQEKEGGEPCFALVQVPSILPRFLELKNEDKTRSFILLESIITPRLQYLFELHDIMSTCMFRITRNADMDIDEEAEDFLGEMQKSIKKRKRGRPVRLELLHKSDKATRAFLLQMLKVKEKDVYEVAGPLDLTFFMKFTGQKGFDGHYFRPIQPVTPAPDFFGYDNIFDAIREKDRLVHHPYESFDCVVGLIQAAAEDETVLAIKQTLYRVSGNSPIIAALMRAAENGKQVTVLVELKARFDEENNINWAKKLEKSGCHVIYGLSGLKTHCKIALIVRREEDGIRRYLHLGTGNYNDSTAKLYTDMSLFTCGERYGTDASSLFNVLTGYSRPPEYNHFVVAPYTMRGFFVRMIRREAENAKLGLPSGITAKVNSLVDPEIIKELYAASQAGVSIRLIVRGVCCLIPGLPGVSAHITVTSIVGQLLEHSRIFRFENAGNPKLYMGSADWMQRNLDRRIELAFPIEDPDLRERVMQVLETLYSDTTNARLMLADTIYQHIDGRGKPTLNSQQYFSTQAVQRLQSLKAVQPDSLLTPIHSADYF